MLGLAMRPILSNNGLSGKPGAIQNVVLSKFELSDSRRCERGVVVSEGETFFEEAPMDTKGPREQQASLPLRTDKMKLGCACIPVAIFSVILLGSEIVQILAPCVLLPLWLLVARDLKPLSYWSGWLTYGGLVLLLTCPWDAFDHERVLFSLRYHVVFWGLPTISIVWMGRCAGLRRNPPALVITSAFVYSFVLLGGWYYGFLQGWVGH